MQHRFENDEEVMQHAVTLAARGVGYVEPNPPVGAVIVDAERNLIAEGWHQNFGGPHAEVNAIAVAGDTEGLELFVTLEPCSHHGKTPPCAEAVVKAGFSRVVIGCQDPAGHVDGTGIAKLRAAGITVDVGVCGQDAEALIAPFRMLMLNRRPWVHAKWAMTLDGKICTQTGHSQWISGKESRATVHQLRGRMDAIVTGAGTVRADDPTLTARPPGARVAIRVVVDSTGRSVSLDGNLVRSIPEAPLLIVTADGQTDHSHTKALAAHGAEILEGPNDYIAAVRFLAVELGKRNVTNLLIEAGSSLMGSFSDAGLIDEVHAFIAPKIVGGDLAKSPLGGSGLDQVAAESQFSLVDWRQSGEDMYFCGRVMRS